MEKEMFISDLKFFTLHFSISFCRIYIFFKPIIVGLDTFFIEIMHAKFHIDRKSGTILS